MAGEKRCQKANSTRRPKKYGVEMFLMLLRSPEKTLSKITEKSEEETLL